MEPVPPYVTLVTTAASFNAGAIMEVQIVNHSSFVLAYNHCYLLLERLTQSGWHGVPEANVRPCTDALRGVAAGSQETIPLFLPTTIGPGTYRVRMERLIVAEQHPPNDGLVSRSQLTTNIFAVR
jgi:hypothetical protein